MVSGMGGLLVNLLCLLVAQACAWHWLRSGRGWLGSLSTLALWGLLDGWLLAQFIYRVQDWPYSELELAFRVVAGAVLTWWLVAQWRRRFSPAARQRDARFQRALQCYLRGEHQAAAALYRRLLAVDPWDAAAWAALGNVRRRQGRLWAARHCYRRCLAVDSTRAFRDHVRQQQGLLR